MSYFAGSNVEEILAQLSTAMGVTNAIGKKEKDEHSSSNRIVWVPKKGKFAAPREQPDDGHAEAEERIIFDVTVWGATFDQLEDLVHKLISTGLVEFSPNGFDPFTHGEGNYTGGDARSKGFARTIPIALLVPVYSETFTIGSGDAPAAAGEVTNTYGEEPEELSP